MKQTMMERFNFNPEKGVGCYPEIAVVRGTWYEMGKQYGQQYKEELIPAILENIGDQIRTWGTYEKAVEAFQPYLQSYDTYLTHPIDGKYTDFIKGVAEEIDLAFDDTMMGFMYVASAEVREYNRRKEQNKLCSATLAWGEALAEYPEKKGVIGAMNADIGFADLHYAPAILAFPSNGNPLVSVHGHFGSAVNGKGLMIESPGGSMVGEDVCVGVFPNIFLAAYCDSVNEAIQFLGKPDEPQNWIPTCWNYNFCLGDASGEACVYSINGMQREIRRKGDVKYVSTKGGGKGADAVPNGDKLTDETGNYLIADNCYFSKNLLSSSRANVEQPIDVYWPDVLARYWTLEKYMQEAIQRGGITVDDLRIAEASHRYYIKEGWSFDSFPQRDFKGRWVPTEIYDKLDEDGGITRAEYYGKHFDAEEWGPPMSKEDSRRVTDWSPGWHEASQWNQILDMNGWSPEPQYDHVKTALRNVFDSNSKKLYLMKGCEKVSVSTVPYAKNAYIMIDLHVTEEDLTVSCGDPAMVIVDKAKGYLKKQLWCAARDLEKENVDKNTVLGMQRYDDLSEATQMVYVGSAYLNLAICCTDKAEKMFYYAKALSTFVKGQICAQMAQTHPERLIKDLGSKIPQMK